jgi:predicted ATPase
LLGGVEISDGLVRVDRFASRAVAALLARLALAPDRAHGREELVELLWPGVALDVGRNRLRQALSTLKSLLEPPGEAASAVLQADRLCVRVLPGGLACDAREFERCLRLGDLVTAKALYRGELMPGHYDDWVLDERGRLAALHESIPAELAPAWPQPSPWAPALPSARRQAAAVQQPPPLPSGLPSFWTRSIGAELTASRLRVLVCAQRLVTVHGPGGSGKTRLAVEVATALRDAQPVDMQDMDAVPPFDRVVFVPLVDCVDARQALDKICSALQGQSDGDAQARIISALTGSKALLVLDNTEQLDADTGPRIVNLLRALPALHVVVTSRRLLDVDGEVAFELDGLPLPAPEASLLEAAASPAVLLFVDRARAVRADFHLSERNVRALVGLVRLLGGMPLAIELAASRVRALTAAELLARLSEGAGTPMLDLLTRSALRTTPGTRHASMRHVVDWSWRQLDAAQAGLLQAMSVFGSAASVPAIAAVANVSPRQAEALLGLLHDASLVHATPVSDAQTRFALLQPVREFAAEAWPEADARQARARLRAWLIAFARQAVPRGPTAVAPEVQHVHASIVSAIADDDAAQALELAITLRPYWDVDDLPLSTLLALEQAAARTNSPALTRAQAADAHELLSLGFGSAGLASQALTHAQAAVDHADDDRGRALALVRRVWAWYFAGQLEVATIMQALDEAAALATRSGDLLARATVLRTQATMVSNLLLDFVESERLATEGQALWETLGHAAMARTMLMGRATMWAWQGRNQDAVPVLQQCEDSARADGDWVGALHAARQLGRVHIRLRQWQPAVVALQRSVQLGWQRRYARGLANALINLPEAMLMAGQPVAAARLHAAAVAHWTRLYGTMNRIEAAEARRTRRLLRLHHGATRADFLREQGLALDLGAAVALALETSAS